MRSLLRRSDGFHYQHLWHRELGRSISHRVAEISHGPLVGSWAPPTFEPLQRFCFGSLYFVTNQLGTLHLCEETMPSMASGGQLPPFRPWDGVDAKALTRRIELLLG